MAILTRCPKCNASIGPQDVTCPLCKATIPRTITGTTLITRPIQAYIELATGSQGIARKHALQSHILTYTIGRAPIRPGLGQPADRINVDAQAVAVAVDHARLHLDLRDPSVPVCRFEDLNSTNGSFRNNRRFSQGVLDDGDELWLGPVNGPSSVRIVYHDPIDKPPLRRWTLNPAGHNPLLIGREVASGHLKLFSESASDHHATIAKVSSGPVTRYELSDAGSKNGTFVNNIRLTPNQRYVLNEGDSVRFADCQYVAQRLDPIRMVLWPLGARADEHIVAQGLTRTVRLDANIWLGEYIRYIWRRASGVQRRRAVGGTVLAPPQRDKALLQEVDLVIGPNDFVILAGSSGSGKTTLMHILSTFIYPQKGTLQYKGQSYKDKPAVLRPHIGYVPQDDIVHEQLTVYEELMYAAELRLPPTVNAEERERRVHMVLKQLRLVPQTRQRISKLSGGQRKRVSIAVELLTKPGILFLDEPTEGQDLALEQSIIVMLRGLSNEGTSVILVSHRLNFLDYVDYVGWLAPGGHMTYFGPPDQLALYYGINPNFTPARRYAAIYDKLDQERNPAQLAGDFKRSSHYQEFVALRQQRPKMPPAPQAGVLRAPSTPASLPSPTPLKGPTRGASGQFRTLYRRGWAVVRADWSFLVWMIVQAPLIGLLLNLLADANMFDELVSPPPSAQKILFALSVSSVWLGVFGAMRELVKERAIYRRERMVGLKLGPYLASKIVLLSTFSIYQSIVLVWLVLSKAHPIQNGVFLPAPLELGITVFLTSFGGMTLGLLLSALARTQEVVGALVPLAVIPQFMLSKALGFSLSGVMEFISRLTFTSWSVEALGATAHLSLVPNGPDYTNLPLRWFMLIILSVLMLVLTWVRQRQRDSYQG